MRKNYLLDSLRGRLAKRLTGCALGLLCSLPLCAADNDFDYFMGKIRNDNMGNPSVSTVQNYMNTLSSSGTWSDYAYSQNDDGNSVYHIDRIKTMAQAYINPANALYGDEALYGKIVLALQGWYDKNPDFSNWWYDQIAEPQRLGIVLILMRAGKKQIPATLETNTLNRMKTDGGNPAAQTGANQTDIATHYIYRALLTQNASLLSSSIAYIFNPVKFVSANEEGLQVDYSFFQHGTQFYVGGYGDEMLKSVTLWATYAEGTQFELDQKRLQIVSEFLRRTYSPIMRGSYMVFNGLGRGISRDGAIKKSGSNIFFNRIAALDKEHATELKTMSQRIAGTISSSKDVKPSHTHFYVADMTVHNRPNYLFNIRTASPRTRRVEAGNGENTLGYFLADGSTNILRTGEEYYQIFPIWDWNFIPGVTAPKVSRIPNNKDWGADGIATFTGGVSDSLYGVTTLVYNDRTAGVNLQAKKSWFFFDDEVVCLGADIICANRTYTTIDQCWGKASYTFQANGTSQAVTEEVSEKLYKDSLDYVLHNNIGYLFPEGSGRIYISNKIQKGKWNNINTGGSTTETSGKVFTLKIDHAYPRSTSPGSYAYIVVPNKTAAQMKAYAEAKDIEILANTKTMQVVHHKKLGVYGMVFFSAGTFTNDEVTVRAEHPCAILVKDADKATATIHVADPGQSKDAFNIGVRIPSVSSKAKVIECDFRNTGNYAGATKAYTITENSQDYAPVGIESAPAENPLSLKCIPAVPKAGQVFDLCTLGTEQGSIEFFNTAGIRVAQTAILGEYTSITLPASGIYAVRVTSGGQSKSFKLLVK